MESVYAYLLLFLTSTFVIEGVYRRTLKGNPEVDISKYVRPEAGEIYFEFRNIRLRQIKNNRKIAYGLVATYALNFWTFNEFVPAYAFSFLLLALVIFLVYEDQSIALKREIRFIERFSDESDKESMKWRF